MIIDQLFFIYIYITGPPHQRGNTSTKGKTYTKGIIQFTRATTCSFSNTVRGSSRACEDLVVASVEVGPVGIVFGLGHFLGFAAE
jgi:hypothetical protein